MLYEQKNGLFVPVSETPPITVFVDETYLLDNTGFLQAAVPIPQNIYTNELVHICRDLLAKLGKDAKEFKGSAISKGNAEIYLQFLRYFVNATAGVRDQVELNPIVTVDAEARYVGGNSEWVFQQVTGGLKNLGIENEDHLVTEFSRQIVWLHRHWQKLTPVRFTNPLVLMFDNKHRYAQKLDEERVVVNDQLIAPMFWELGKTMTSFANTLFTQMEPHIPIARITRFDIGYSPSEFGLQAADLFSNLLHCALKCEMGIKDATNDLKYEMLLHVMPDFKLSPQLQASLAIDKDKEGRDALRCIDPQLLSTFQFLPA
jgi:hypothetical protein